jgi:microcystin-dependent protein
MAIATLLPNARQQFINANGSPLVGGFVYMYVPNTTTLKTTWADAGETTPNSNPIVLDDLGSAAIYGSGQYTQTVTDSLGNLIWTGLVQDSYGLIISGNNTFAGNNTFSGTNSFTGTTNFTGATTAVTQATGDDSTLIATDQFVQNAIANVTVQIPVGTVAAYAGSTAPTGWVLCFGQGVSTSTFAKLFNVIGYSFGGSGSIFNIPDLRGNVPAGLDNMGGTSAGRLTTASMTPNAFALGATGGAETITLNISQIPAHQHQFAAMQILNNNQLALGEGGGPNIQNNTNAETDSTGGGNSHLNVQPTLLLNYIIYTGNASGSNSPVYDLISYYPGSPTNNAILSNLIMVRSVEFQTNFPGSYASSSTAATASTVFTIKKNGTSVGTITFAISGTTGTFASSGVINFVAGDVLSIDNQAIADATIANISISITGTES